MCIFCGKKANKPTYVHCYCKNESSKSLIPLCCFSKQAIAFFSFLFPEFEGGALSSDALFFLMDG
eukprot:m.156429 g.156429  ORF g.156429 m.156429 type:complete len:65 (+) comp16295_c0_seq3:1260-1454(+)